MWSERKARIICGEGPAGTNGLDQPGAPGSYSFSIIVAGVETLITRESHHHTRRLGGRCGADATDNESARLLVARTLLGPFRHNDTTVAARCHHHGDCQGGTLGTQDC